MNVYQDRNNYLSGLDLRVRNNYVLTLDGRSNLKVQENIQPGRFQFLGLIFPSVDDLTVNLEAIFCR